MGLEQNMIYARSRGLLRHMPVRMSRHENDRNGDIPFTQTLSHVQPIDVRHLVVDHQAIDIVRVNGRQQRQGGTERANLETMGFEKKSQRLKHSRIVVQTADCVLRGISSSSKAGAFPLLIPSEAGSMILI